MKYEPDEKIHVEIRCPICRDVVGVVFDEDGPVWAPAAFARHDRPVEEWYARFRLEYMADAFNPDFERSLRAADAESQRLRTDPAIPLLECEQHPGPLYVTPRELHEHYKKAVEKGKARTIEAKPNALHWKHTVR